MKNNIIAVDFDGTLCENKYPEIGEPNMELIDFLMSCQLNGDTDILKTLKSIDMSLKSIAKSLQSPQITVPKGNDNGILLCEKEEENTYDN